MKNKKVVLAAIMLAAIVIRLVVSWQPVPTLIEKIVLDDSFYGYAIAQHMAAGSLTYNGIDVTNGFQPLWIFLIAPVYLITSNIYLAVNMILTIETILDALIVLLIFMLSKKIFDERTALLAAFVWAINPLTMFQTLGGIDVTLYIVMILATLTYYLNIKDKLTMKNLAGLGILLGLTFLARGDGIFLFLVITAHMFYTHRKKLAIRKFALYLAVTLLVVAPWLAWSYLNFGTIQQSSQIANYDAGHGIVPYYDLKQPTTLSENAAAIGENVIRTVGALSNQLGIVDYNLNLITLIFALFYGILLINSLKFWRKMTLPIAFSLLLIVFYAAYLWGIQIRYTTAVVPFLVMMASASFFDLAYSRLGSKSLVIILLISLLFLSNGLTQWDRGYFSWQREIYNDALWIGSNTPKDAIVGGFASGIPIYFSNRTMINLDGVLNYKALDAILNRSMYSYMKSRNISYWVESSYHNQTAIEEYQNGTFDILRENQWHAVFEPNANLTLIENRCGIYRHLRGFDMLVCFFKARVL
jgi:4-amino-4-deoxy-L-arabinose transferase-like glycosyltransferase